MGKALFIDYSPLVVLPSALMSPDRILELLRPIAEQIAHEATQSAREELLMQLGAVKQPVPVAALPSGKRNNPLHCIYPNCSKKHRGPKASFMCEDHYGIPKVQKTKYLKAWKDSQ